MQQALRPRAHALAVVPLIAAAVVACAGSTPSSAPATALPPGTVAVEAKDFQFTPATLTVPAGSVTFALKNVGSQDHQLKVYQGDQAIGGIDRVAPGQTTVAPVTLAAGQYTFVCTLNGHDQLGMKGTLTVTGG